jgi:hypothetical protein
MDYDTTELATRVEEELEILGRDDESWLALVPQPATNRRMGPGQHTRRED